MSHVALIFATTGHVYVNTRGYVSIHIYTPDGTLAAMIADEINGHWRKHGNIFDVSVTNREAIAYAARHLLTNGFAIQFPKRRKLELALEYASASTRAERNGIAAQLRVLPGAVPKESPRTERTEG